MTGNSLPLCSPFFMPQKPNDDWSCPLDATEEQRRRVKRLALRGRTQGEIVRVTGMPYKEVSASLKALRSSGDLPSQPVWTWDPHKKQRTPLQKVSPLEVLVDKALRPTMPPLCYLERAIDRELNPEGQIVLERGKSETHGRPFRSLVDATGRVDHSVRRAPPEHRTPWKSFEQETSLSPAQRREKKNQLYARLKQEANPGPSFPP